MYKGNKPKVWDPAGSGEEEEESCVPDCVKFQTAASDDWVRVGTTNEISDVTSVQYSTQLSPLYKLPPCISFSFGVKPDLSSVVCNVGASPPCSCCCVVVVVVWWLRRFQLVWTFPVQPEWLEMLTGHPSDKRNSKKWGWTFTRDCCGSVGRFNNYYI